MVSSEWSYLHDVLDVLDVDVQIEQTSGHFTGIQNIAGIFRGSLEETKVMLIRWIPPFFPHVVERLSRPDWRVPWMILWIAIQKISTFRKENLQELQFFNSTGTYGYLHEIWVVRCTFSFSMEEEATVFELFLV